MNTAVLEDTQLIGWDKIADYLGVSCKTAQSYESEGLPIYRYPGGRVVYAFLDELHAWKRSLKPAYGR